ncbi:hypothetical protein HDU81_004943 [Chytriomyces hyalinus]|nr:hypothetical protein HDU81_004943 [Chytriomyces hyalinus]
MEGQSADTSQSSTSPLNPTRILYQTTDAYYCFDLEEKSVYRVTEDGAKDIAVESETFYIIDGDSMALRRSRFTLFIGCPLLDHYHDFVYKRKAVELFFPTWTLAELEACRRSCYPTITVEQVRERYGYCGGVARLVLDPDASTNIPDSFMAALANVNALEAVRYDGDPSSISADAHALIHVVIGTDEAGRPYQFLGLDLASRYIGKKLLEKDPDQMMAHVQEMLSESPRPILTHLFQIYAQNALSLGGRELNCRNLITGEHSKLVLDKFGGKRAPLKPMDLRGHPIREYHEPLDDDHFPAVDALSKQGMFQIIVDADHPIQDVQVLKELCALYDEPKLYFVVPPPVFKDFAKQKFLGMDVQSGVNLIENLDQYVLELPVKPEE